MIIYDGNTCSEWYFIVMMKDVKVSDCYQLILYKANTRKLYDKCKFYCSNTNSGMKVFNYEFLVASISYDWEQEVWTHWFIDDSIM